MNFKKEHGFRKQLCGNKNLQVFPQFSHAFLFSQPDDLFDALITTISTIFTQIYPILEKNSKATNHDAKKFINISKVELFATFFGLTLSTGMLS